MASNLSATNFFRVHNYLIGNVIHKSKYSIVRFATNVQQDKLFVAKLFKKSSTCNRILENESYLAPLLCHKNIIPVIEVFESKNLIFQISPYIEGGDLLHRLKNSAISQQQITSYIKYILSAVRYLHSRNICHRDIKLENILVTDEGKVYLIDFGFATITFDGEVKDQCGSALYVAPEVCSLESYDGFKADIFSLGVVIYSMFSGRFPVLNSCSGSPDFEKIPTEFTSIVKKMLDINPKERPDIREVCESFKVKPDVHDNSMFLPNHISDSFDQLDDDIVSRLSQMLEISFKEVKELICSCGLSNIKLYYLLYKEMKVVRSYNGVKYSSCPLADLSSFNVNVVTRKYAADESQVLKKLREYLSGLKTACLSNPTTRDRKIVLNLEQETCLFDFELNHADSFCQLTLRTSSSSNLINDIEELLSKNFSVVSG